MARSKTISINEAALLTDLLKLGNRSDGRRLNQFRDVSIEFGATAGDVRVKLGKTFVMARISAEVVKPAANRPFEGVFFISTDVSAMASPVFDNKSKSSQEVLISRLVEKAIRRSDALDLESLCIQSTKSVWMIRADVHYLNYDGGLVDATSIAVMTALLHYRLPITSIDGSRTFIVPSSEATPTPLSIRHIPLCVSFVFYEDELSSEQVVEQDTEAVGNDDMDEMEEDVENDDDPAKLITLMDATAVEENLITNAMTITANSEGDLCQVSKPGGIAVSSEVILDCVESSTVVIKRLTDLIKRRLKEDAEVRYKYNKVLLAENERDS